MDAVIAHEDEVPWPSYTEQMDYELELACIIGRPGSDIPAGEADRYIFGYTIMNDFSARDIQQKEMSVGLGPAKGKDFATALGPWIVTADAIGDVYNLSMIAHASNCETLVPGDLIGSGTVGWGCGEELGRYLQPGDVVELEVENIGVLRNTIGEPRQQPAGSRLK